jgi:hypothetical protein
MQKAFRSLLLEQRARLAAFPAGHSYPAGHSSTRLRLVDAGPWAVARRHFLPDLGSKSKEERRPKLRGAEIALLASSWRTVLRSAEQRAAEAAQAHTQGAATATAATATAAAAAAPLELVLTNIAESLARGGHHAQSADCVAEMRARGVAPRPQTLERLIQAQSAAGDARAALQTLDAMLALHGGARCAPALSAALGGLGLPSHAPLLRELWARACAHDALAGCAALHEAAVWAAARCRLPRVAEEIAACARARGLPLGTGALAGLMQVGVDALVGRELFSVVVAGRSVVFF